MMCETRTFYRMRKGRELLHLSFHSSSTDEPRSLLLIVSFLKQNRKASKQTPQSLKIRNDIDQTETSSFHGQL